MNQGRPKTSWNQFNNFFARYDDNGDGVISKGECYNFVSEFLNQGQTRGTQDSIFDLVQKIFAKYDTDRSGFLEKREVLKLLDEILLSQGR